MMCGMRKRRLNVIKNNYSNDINIIKESSANLHEKVFNIITFKDTHFLTERDLVYILEISKSQIHRYITISKLPEELIINASKHETQMYVLIIVSKLFKTISEETYFKLLDQVNIGSIKTIRQLKSYCNAWNISLKEKTSFYS